MESSNILTFYLCINYSGLRRAKTNANENSILPKPKHLDEGGCGSENEQQLLTKDFK